jgi:hypothetical protein
VVAKSGDASQHGPAGGTDGLQSEAPAETPRCLDTRGLVSVSWNVPEAAAENSVAQGWTAGSVNGLVPKGHAAWPNPLLLIPVPPFGFNVMSKTMLSG